MRARTKAFAVSVYAMLKRIRLDDLKPGSCQTTDKKRFIGAATTILLHAEGRKLNTIQNFALWFEECE